jgi:membrane protein
VYWSAQIFLLGAEFTWVYARRCGSLRGQAEREAEHMPARPSQ